MCCLFGMLDVNHRFSSKKKSRIVSALAIASEARGTDATGIAYNANGSLHIYKRPVPAHKLRFHIPGEATFVMGHTRMTTQGSAKRLENNHPFRGKADTKAFALAHNGVLYNDHWLRQTEHLPATTIETDSYVAVQLIEQTGTLSFESLKHMAELVEGSFNFSVLDAENTLYLIKGDNPLCLYHFCDIGLYLYASTEEILTKALLNLRMDLGIPRRIHVDDGEILKISPNGSITRSTFRMHETSLLRYYSYHWPPHDSPAPKQSKSNYRKQIVDFGRELGVSVQELNHLARSGVSDLDLENAIFDDGFRIDLLLETGYYDNLERGWLNESVAHYAR